MNCSICSYNKNPKNLFSCNKCGKLLCHTCISDIKNHNSHSVVDIIIKNIKETVTEILEPPKLERQTGFYRENNITTDEVDKIKIKYENIVEDIKESASKVEEQYAKQIDTLNKIIEEQKKALDESTKREDIKKKLRRKTIELKKAQMNKKFINLSKGKSASD